MHVGELLRDDGAEDDLARAEALEEYVVWIGLARAITDAGAGAWADSASCRGQTSVMFPKRGGSVAAAQALCASCPVVDECRAWGDRMGRDQEGIVAGESGRERRRRRRREAIDRSALAPVAPLTLPDEVAPPAYRPGRCDCAACGRIVSLEDDDRLRGGYCPACSVAWRRARRADGSVPNRVQFEATRASSQRRRRLGRLTQAIVQSDVAASAPAEPCAEN